MSGTARNRHFAEFMAKMYPAFSRRATQVCVLSSALERIEGGAPDVQAIARAALDEANAFDWKNRVAQRESYDRSMNEFFLPDGSARPEDGVCQSCNSEGSKLVCTAGQDCVALSNPLPVEVELSKLASVKNDSLSPVREAYRDIAPCAECRGTGQVYDGNGDGPWRCYACRPEDWAEQQATGDPVTDRGY